ncbi:MAG: purine-binding chemotaxis protein CheW [Desulfobacterales bacterium]|nr:purine-binding chemotaxis protein CheW [Desulfobacterales bacterium]
MDKPKIDVSGKYLTFELKDEAYGISVLKIREIIGIMPITSMPQLPYYAKGVINLRDKVIPVMDLKAKFGINDNSEDSCIIIVEVSNTDFPFCNEQKKCDKVDCPSYESLDRQCWKTSGTFCRNEIQGTFHSKIEACRKCDYYIDAHEKGGIIPIGFIVDRVSNVVSINDAQISTTPSFGEATVDIEYILGIAKLEEGINILLDVESIFSNEN